MATATRKHMKTKSITLLNRTTVETSRLLEFFNNRSELTMQLGYSFGDWPRALVKELIDNGLDACEQADIAPEIVVTVEPDAFSIQDNGPGLPESTLLKALDYSIRVSNKAPYVSPTRGRLGNALKCLWAAPFIADGERGHVEVRTGGVRYSIDVTLDRIAQHPQLTCIPTPDDVVKSGTLIKVTWRNVASSLDPT